jgi:hypothetical protein
VNDFPFDFAVVPPIAWSTGPPRSAEKTPERPGAAGFSQPRSNLALIVGRHGGERTCPSPAREVPDHRRCHVIVERRAACPHNRDLSDVRCHARRPTGSAASYWDAHQRDCGEDSVIGPIAGNQRTGLFLATSTPRGQLSRPIPLLPLPGVVPTSSLPTGTFRHWAPSSRLLRRQRRNIPE